jgi:hypothetical protein
MIQKYFELAIEKVMIEQPGPTSDSTQGNKPPEDTPFTELESESEREKELVPEKSVNCDKDLICNLQWRLIGMQHILNNIHICN